MGHRRARPAVDRLDVRPRLRRHRHAGVPRDEPERPRPGAPGRRPRRSSRAPPSCATSPPATAASPSGPRTRSPARRSTCGPNGARRRCSRLPAPGLLADARTAPPAATRRPRGARASSSNLDILEAQLGDGPWSSAPTSPSPTSRSASPLYRYFTIDLADRRDRPGARRLLRPALPSARPTPSTSWSPTTSLQSRRRPECRPTTSSSAPARPARPSPTGSARPGARSSSSSTAAPTGARSSRCRRRSPTR